MEEKIKIIFCCIGSLVVNALGGWDIWLASLFTVIVLDIVTGIIKAILMRSNKSSSGGLNSTSMFKGGVKKVIILILVALGEVIDNILPTEEAFIRTMIVSYYIANESLSILENIGACGIPLPKGLFKVLDALKNEDKE